MAADLLSDQLGFTADHMNSSPANSLLDNFLFLTVQMSKLCHSTPPARDQTELLLYHTHEDLRVCYIFKTHILLAK